MELGVIYFGKFFSRELKRENSSKKTNDIYKAILQLTAHSDRLSHYPPIKILP